MSGCSRDPSGGDRSTAEAPAGPQVLWCLQFWGRVRSTGCSYKHCTGSLGCRNGGGHTTQGLLQQPVVVTCSGVAWERERECCGPADGCGLCCWPLLSPLGHCVWGASTARVLLAPCSGFTITSRRCHVTPLMPSTRSMT